MKRVDANFATPGRPGRWHWVAAAVLFVLSMGLAAHAVSTQFELRDAQRSVRTLQAQIAAQSLPASAPTPPYDASAREMLRERDATWVEVLTALESVGMSGITVTAINMPAAGGSITVQLTATDYRILLEYLASLNGPVVETGALRFDLQQARAEGSNGLLSVTLITTRAVQSVPSRAKASP